jgi:hypothetical protein
LLPWLRDVSNQNQRRIRAMCTFVSPVSLLTVFATRAASKLTGYTKRFRDSNCSASSEG